MKRSRTKSRKSFSEVSPEEEELLSRLGGTIEEDGSVEAQSRERAIGVEVEAAGPAEPRDR